VNVATGRLGVGVRSFVVVVSGAAAATGALSAAAGDGAVAETAGSLFEHPARRVIGSAAIAANGLSSLIM
jgi:hypothetical protein